MRSAAGKSRRRPLTGTGWRDISVSLHPRMIHWPDNPRVRVQRTKNMNRGANCNVSLLSMGSHSGTHMDAPLHFMRSGAGIDQIPPDAVIGRSRVIEIRDPESIKPRELIRHRIQRGERILFKTRNSPRCWKRKVFSKDFVYLSTEAAQMLIRRRIKTVGIDYLSIAGYKKNSLAVHQLLLKRGIWIIEGLNMTGIRPGMVDLICLPLKILKGDGAPARALIKRI